MMRLDVGPRVVGFVFVAADRDGEIGLRFCSEGLDEFIERNPADFCWPAEVGVVCDGVTHLR